MNICRFNKDGISTNLVGLTGMLVDTFESIAIEKNLYIHICFKNDYQRSKGRKILLNKLSECDVQIEQFKEGGVNYISCKFPNDNRGGEKSIASGFTAWNSSTRECYSTITIEAWSHTTIKGE
jgi:hypothetical protein